MDINQHLINKRSDEIGKKSRALARTICKKKYGKNYTFEQFKKESDIVITDVINSMREQSERTPIGTKSKGQKFKNGLISALEKVTFTK